MVYRLIISTALLLALCLFSPRSSGDSLIANGVISTSLVRLLSAPEQYSEKQVRVIGYFTKHFEGTALYLTKEHAENHDTQSAIWIDIRGTNALLRKVKTGYVEIMGTSYCETNSSVGHFGAYPAGIKNVRYIGNRTK